MKLLVLWLQSAALCVLLYQNLPPKPSASETPTDEPGVFRKIRVVDDKGRVCISMDAADGGGIVQWFSYDDEEEGAAAGRPRLAATLGSQFPTMCGLMLYDPGTERLDRPLLRATVSGKPIRAEVVGLTLAGGETFSLGTK